MELSLHLLDLLTDFVESFRNVLILGLVKFNSFLITADFPVARAVLVSTHYLPTLTTQMHIFNVMELQLRLRNELLAEVLPSRQIDRLLLLLFFVWLDDRIQGRLGPKIGRHDLAHLHSQAILEPTAAIAVGSCASSSPSVA